MKKNSFRIIASVGIGIWVGWIFYQHFLGIIIGVIVVMSLLHLTNTKEHIEKKKMLEFKLFLNGIYTELIIGQSLRNSIHNTIMNTQFSDRKMINSVHRLMHEMSLGQSEILAWERFSKEINLPICDQFVQLFKATYLYGGEIVFVLKESIKMISDQIDLDLEIDVILSAKKYEFYLMMTLPLVILSMLFYSDGGYMQILYTTILGRIVMSLVLATLCTAFIIGHTIIKIEV